MISSLLVRFGGWRGCALAAGLCLSAGFATGWTVRGWRAAEQAARTARAEAGAVQRTLAAERRTVDVAARSGAKAEARAEAVRTVTRTLIDKVPVYVTEADDARCALPAGFVRLHDAAAAGLSPAPSTPGQSDEVASAVELSAVARTVARNYGVCHEAAEQVRGWQDFYAGVQAAVGAEP